MATAADVPSKYDLVINDGTNTTGFAFLRTLDGSYLTANRHRAEYTSTPTFVERSNVSNAYGDNSQDFFLTTRQRDWSLGEQQKFFRSGNDGRYWVGQNVDVSTPGQVKLTPSFTVSSALSEAVTAGCRGGATFTNIDVTGPTKMFNIDSAGAATSLGTHGLGATPSYHGTCTDGNLVYLSTSTAGTVGVRKWNGSAFSTFSASPADALAFLNNTLFGLTGLAGASSPQLIQYDTAGTATVLYSWKQADGSLSFTPSIGKIEAFGGKLLILLSFGQDAGAELWIYDGAGTSRLENFPPNLWGWDVEVLYGVAYISGSFLKVSGGATYGRPCVHFFDGSQVGLLWQANDYNAAALTSIAVGPHPALAVFDGKLVFTDDTTGNVVAYSPARGGVSTIGTYTRSGDRVRLLASGMTMLHTRNQTTYGFYPSTTYSSSGYVISSLIDFESSLPKQFRGVKVEWAAASDGDGGSVDIAYQVDSVDGSWTTLRTGAVSGTEYTFSNVSGHAIAIKVTLNKGTSTAGPVLKSLNVRAAPVLTAFKVRTYNLDLTSTTEHTTVLQDNSNHPLSGFTQAQRLQTAIAAAPITITDKFGTFTGICEPSNCSILEVHSDGNTLAMPGQFIAQINVREI